MVILLSSSSTKILLLYQVKQSNAYFLVSEHLSSASAITEEFKLL